MNDETKQSIARTIDLARSFPSAAEYARHCERLQSVLASLSRRLWRDGTRRFALYCCRHEFIAQAKLVYHPEEVAALVGHVSDETPCSHYGRRGKQTAGEIDIDLPEPDAAEVARVRKTVASKLEALAKLHEKDAPIASAQSGAAREEESDNLPSLECFPVPVTETDERPSDPDLWPDFRDRLRASLDELRPGGRTRESKARRRGSERDASSDSVPETEAPSLRKR